MKSHYCFSLTLLPPSFLGFLVKMIFNKYLFISYYLKEQNNVVQFLILKGRVSFSFQFYFYFMTSFMQVSR
jgi:hypothetical protein